MDGGFRRHMPGVIIDTCTCKPAPEVHVADSFPKTCSQPAGAMIGMGQLS